MPGARRPSGAGSDAHAKNCSVLLSGPNVRLAPLYDLASALPHPDMPLPKVRLAMKFAGAYTFRSLDRKIWTKLAAEVGLPEEDVLGQARQLISAAPQAFSDAAGDPGVKRLRSDLPARLTDAVAARARECAASL